MIFKQLEKSLNDLKINESKGRAIAGKGRASRFGRSGFQFVALVLTGVLFSGSGLFAWGSHYLVTDRLFEHPSTAKLVAGTVEPESLDSFVRAQRTQLKKLFADYYAWLAKRESARFTAQTFDPAKASVAEFLKAARLNPKTKFPLVSRDLPGEKAGKIYPYKDISPYLVDNASTFVQFRAAPANMAIHRVLATYSDEPDWGMDHSLFVFKEYGYGEQPYGKPKGESSKAPFHMQFMHENFLVGMFASEILEGMVLDRIELFSRLSALALATGHDYWGWRFAAWALHYIQDIAQPYHAKAVPHAGGWYYTKFILLFWKQGQIKKETTQLVANRHFAYEDFVAVGLARSYTTDKDLYAKLAGFLRSGPAGLPEISSGEDLMGAVTEFSSDHGEDLDERIVDLLGSKYTEDPSYDMEKDTEFDIMKVLADAPQKKKEKLLLETGADFTMTGRASRELIRLIREKYQKPANGK